ncbi:MAG: chorismate synthase [Nitrospirae bacterium]|nr:MAG: chorismate synthase [Nitrospirota bacterium]
MFKLRFLTAGESHGKALTGIIEGIPANLELTEEYINVQLKRRQKGYGRGGRMKIESDRVEILSGVRWGKTLGSPLSLMVKNRDWENWIDGMGVDSSKRGSISAVTRPRPGHADLPGIIKYNQQDIRNILERSSARETTMRVALGSVARRLLEEFGIKIGGFVTSIGSVRFSVNQAELVEAELLELFRKADESELSVPDGEVERRMKDEIDRAKAGGYSLGGTFVVFATGLPVGLGSHIQWDRRLDARIAQAMMGIQAIKGVEIGTGFLMSERPGSEVMDELFPSTGERPLSVRRKTNHAGGIEGGMTNGMPVLVRAAMKPIPTQARPLKSIDIETGEAIEAAYERSDVCAVPAAEVIGEAMLALVLCDAFLEKFGGDSIEEIEANLKNYLSSYQ